MRQYKTKYETVVKDETPRSGSTQTVIGEEQTISMNSIVADDTTKPEPEGRLVGDVHKGKRKR